MELYTGDVKVLKEEIEKLRDDILRGKNVNEIVNIYTTLDAIIPSYSALSGEDTAYYKKINKNKYLSNLTDYRMRKLYNHFIENFISNKEFHGQLSNDVLNTLNDCLDNIENFNMKKKMFSEKEIIEIMLDFLKQKGNDNDKLLLKTIENKRMFQIEDDYSNCDGYTTFNCNSKITNIFINHAESDVSTMATIIHEIGHVADFRDLIKRFSKKEQCEFFLKPVYSEVISKLYEKQFIDYLIENNIAVNDAKLELETFFGSTLESTQELLFLTALDKELFVKERYRDLDKSDFLEIVLPSIHIEVDTSDITDPEDIDIIDSTIYTYGGIISTYLSNLEKNDSERFKIIYKEFLDNRIKYFDKDILNILQTSNEGLSNATKEEFKILERPKIKKYTK